MKSGKFDIEVLDTGLFALDGGSMFGVVPKVMWSKAYNPGDEKNRIPLAARPLLIRTDDMNILVDTGNGNKGDERFNAIYSIDTEKSDINKALRKFDLTKDDINAVILTHLHFDHAGGATILDNGKLIPTFPNAKYYVQKDHLEWALNPTEKDRASFIPENFMPLLAEGVLEKIDGPGELFDGIELIPVNGHTKSMQMIKIKTKDQTFLYPADLSPTSAHIKVPFGLGYDNFPLTTIEEKKQWWPRAFEEQWTLIFEHDAFTQACLLIEGKKGIEAGQQIKIT